MTHEEKNNPQAHHPFIQLYIPSNYLKRIGSKSWCLLKAPEKCPIQIQIAFFVAEAVFPSLWVFWLDTLRTRLVCAAKEKSHIRAKKMAFFPHLGEKVDLKE